MKLLALLAVTALADDRPIKLETIPHDVTLRGARAQQQFLAIATYADGSTRDVTADAAWSLTNPALASIAPPAQVRAAADGKLAIAAKYQGLKAQSNLHIEAAQIERPFSFARDIGGILTKRGCNNSACHGGVKGRGGLKLSAGGLHPKDDFDWITKGGVYQVLTTEVKGERVPRIDTVKPAASLLLTKPTNTTPHGGGKRFDADSEDYRAIENWVRNGAPYGDEQAAPKIDKLEVYPATLAIEANSTHRLLVTAQFADGRKEDYTSQVVFTSNNAEVASIRDNVVTANRLGETAILIRAPGQIATAGVGVIGPAIANYPATKSANFIDDPIFAKLKQFHLAPSALSTDGEFLRRVCLDLTGTLPPPPRVREFIASKDPKKRERVIDALIASPEFVDYWTFRFSDIFRVAIFANGLTPKFSQKYWEWIRENISTNRPYDDVARERLSAQGYSAASRHFIPYNQIGVPADTMAEEVRVFFGRRLDCAQCHNHPYESWSQDQFWGMAAFFGRMFKMGAVVFDHPANMDLGSKDVDGKIGTIHPRTKAEVQPALLDGSPLDVAPDGNPRKELARWMTSHPYFAEASVNRVWGQFFGRGIVDPVDDFRSTNPPTHPALLTALAADFAMHKYDLRHLMKTIVMSRAYQLSHEPNSSNRADVANYSHSYARAIDAEVLLDAVVDVTGVPEAFGTAVNDGSAVGQAPAGTRAINLQDPDMYFSRFLELYGRPNRGAIPERSGKPNLGQALHMLAGSGYTNRLAAKDSRLAKLLAAKKTNAEIFEDFYLAALARPPSREEVAELEGILTKRPDRETGLREFVWAIVSSREFAENH